MNTQQIQPSNKRAIEGLLSEGPNPKFEKKLMLFGQFVGDWDILEDRFYKSDGKPSLEQNLTRGELHWGWILDGRAVQDVWMSIDEKTGKAVPEGTTIRFYDEKIDVWHSVWISPTQGVVKTFVARQVGEEIVLEGRTPEGYPVKWIFSEITPNSFRWRAEETRDNGKTWTLREEMQIRRRPKAKWSEKASTTGPPTDHAHQKQARRSAGFKRAELTKLVKRKSEVAGRNALDSGGSL